MNTPVTKNLYYQFKTIQGPVRFYNNERRANILVKQFQVNKEIKIGEYNSIENRLMFESGEPLKWVSKMIPFKTFEIQ